MSYDILTEGAVPCDLKTHPNLKPILTFPKGRNKLLLLLTSNPS